MVVNAPVLGAVEPIGGGDAKSAVNPAPLTVPDDCRLPKVAGRPVPKRDVNKLVNPEPVIVPDADKSVNAPVFADEDPIGGGIAKRLVNPAPLTVPLAAKVVKDPAPPPLPGVAICTVVPPIWANSPIVVAQRSPLFGTKGATPKLRLIPAIDVVDGAMTKRPVMESPALFKGVNPRLSCLEVK